MARILTASLPGAEKINQETKLESSPRPTMPQPAEYGEAERKADSMGQKEIDTAIPDALLLKSHCNIIIIVQPIYCEFLVCFPFSPLPVYFSSYSLIHCMKVELLYISFRVHYSVLSVIWANGGGRDAWIIEKHR
jgi:hypothetical protein